jgi:hypothetical protein
MMGVSYGELRASIIKAINDDDELDSEELGKTLSKVQLTARFLLRGSRSSVET